MGEAAGGAAVFLGLLERGLAAAADALYVAEDQDLIGIIEADQCQEERDSGPLQQQIKRHILFLIEGGKVG